MLNAIVTGTHRLRNHSQDEVSRLAELFHILFEHYTSYSSPVATDFVQFLRTLAGLGFTACLADRGFIACYQIYLTYFLDHDQGDFRKHPHSFIHLSQMIAHMVLLALDSFRFLHGANYYADFMAILKRIGHDVILVTRGKRDEVTQLLEWLERKSR